MQFGLCLSSDPRAAKTTQNSCAALGLLRIAAVKENPRYDDQNDQKSEAKHADEANRAPNWFGPLSHKHCLSVSMIRPSWLQPG
jgi:hypothetical protein